MILYIHLFSLSMTLRILYFVVAVVLCYVSLRIQLKLFILLVEDIHRFFMIVWSESFMVLQCWVVLVVWLIYFGLALLECWAAQQTSEEGLPTVDAVGTTWESERTSVTRDARVRVLSLGGAGTAKRACGYQHYGIPFLVRPLHLIIFAAYIFHTPQTHSLPKARTSPPSFIFLFHLFYILFCTCISI